MTCGLKEDPHEGNTATSSSSMQLKAIPHVLILDMGPVNFMDSVATNCLSKVVIMEIKLFPCPVTWLHPHTTHTRTHAHALLCIKGTISHNDILLPFSFHLQDIKNKFINISLGLYSVCRNCLSFCLPVMQVLKDLDVGGVIVFLAACPGQLSVLHSLLSS